ncbi:MAG: hypothetical protein CMO98_06315 [Woeseia sp.]|nr:hypothetical protein [Woeseia sp.]
MVGLEEPKSGDIKSSAILIDHEKDRIVSPFILLPGVVGRCCTILRCLMVLPLKWALARRFSYRRVCGYGESAGLWRDITLG